MSWPSDQHSCVISRFLSPPWGRLSEGFRGFSPCPQASVAYHRVFLPLWIQSCCARCHSGLDLPRLRKVSRSTVSEASANSLRALNAHPAPIFTVKRQFVSKSRMLCTAVTTVPRIHLYPWGKPGLKKKKTGILNQILYYVTRSQLQVFIYFTLLYFKA